MRSSRLVFAVLALTLFAARPAEATFHLMQIERVIGGVNGNTTIQAIQLRMRASGQNLVSNSALFAHDASGLNPVTLISFPTDVGNFASDSRVLAATAN